MRLAVSVFQQMAPRLSWGKIAAPPPLFKFPWSIDSRRGSLSRKPRSHVRNNIDASNVAHWDKGKRCRVYVEFWRKLDASSVRFDHQNVNSLLLGHQLLACSCKIGDPLNRFFPVRKKIKESQNCKLLANENISETGEGHYGYAFVTCWTTADCSLLRSTLKSYGGGSGPRECFLSQCTDQVNSRWQ